MDFFPYLEIKSLRLDFYPKNNNYKHSYSEDPKCRNSKNVERKKKKKEREREEEEEEEMEMQFQRDPSRSATQDATRPRPLSL